MQDLMKSNAEIAAAGVKATPCNPKLGGAGSDIPSHYSTKETKIAINGEATLPRWLEWRA